MLAGDRVTETTRRQARELLARRRRTPARDGPMIVPTLAPSSARSRAGGKLVPVYREVFADHDTPVSAFRKIDDGAVRVPARERRGRREVGALLAARQPPVAGVRRARRPLRDPSRTARSRRCARPPARGARRRCCASTRRWRCPGCRASAAARSATSATTRCAGSSACPRDAPGRPRRCPTRCSCSATWSACSTTSRTRSRS